MRFIATCATVAVAVASFANAAPVSSIPGLTELQAWRTIFDDPNVNRSDYGTPASRKFLSPKHACHLYCGTVAGLVRKEACMSNWKEIEEKCSVCFENDEYGADLKQFYGVGVTEAVKKCSPDGQAEKPDAVSEWVKLGNTLGLSEEQVACHRACGGIITNGREGNCDLLRDSPDYIPLCQKCARPNGIWGIYQDGAQAGAAKCGLTVNPQ